MMMVRDVGIWISFGTFGRGVMKGMASRGHRLTVQPTR